MLKHAPESLVLFGIGVLNIWAALILASVRSRSNSVEPLPAVPAPIETGRAEAAGI